MSCLDVSLSNTLMRHIALCLDVSLMISITLMRQSALGLIKTERTLSPPLSASRESRMCAYLCVCVYIFIYIYACTCTHTHVHVYVYVHVYMYMCVCVHCT